MTARERYSRQFVLPEVGLVGQAALSASSVLIVGAGGLASPLLAYLTAAGIGRVVLVDGDAVELSNLPRQFLYAPSDLGLPKVEAARARLALHAPDGTVESRVERLTPDNVWELLDGISVVVDASDNFGTRFLLNDACRLRRVPWVHGGVTRFAGLVTTFLPDGPCYRCFFPEPPLSGRIPACGETGVLGPAVGVVGSWQALEAVKICVGNPTATLSGRVIHFDFWNGRVDELELRQATGCPLCGPDPEIVSIESTEASYLSSWGRD